MEQKQDGCIVFLFGRNLNGESVCLRQEGVHPRLYYEMSEGDTRYSIKAVESLVMKELWTLVRKEVISSLLKNV